jgi:hypothetical protein
VRDFSLELVAKVQQLGLIEIERDKVVVRYPSFLRVGQTLAELGVPAGVIIDSYVHLRQQLAAIAGEFAVLFETHVNPPGSETDLVVQAQQLEKLSNAAVDVVSAELRRALREEADRRLASS